MISISLVINSFSSKSSSFFKRLITSILPVILSFKSVILSKILFKLLYSVKTSSLLSNVQKSL